MVYLRDGGRRSTRHHMPMRESYIWLPQGYRLDTSDPDVWFLNRADGTTAAAFCPEITTGEALLRAAVADLDSTSGYTRRTGQGLRLRRDEDPRRSRGERRHRRGSYADSAIESW
jgi:hypothetical protein